jgi:hypothetical protein
MATLDGSAIFGLATHFTENPVENEHQINQFFGINGLQSLFGGQRGRTIHVTGVLVASSPAGLTAARNIIMNFADGLTHTLVDNFGDVYVNVIFKGNIGWSGPPRPGFNPSFGNGFFRPYQMLLVGLT